MREIELTADIIMGIWLHVTRSILERGARHDLTREALDAVLRALGAPRPEFRLRDYDGLVQPRGARDPKVVAG